MHASSTFRETFRETAEEVHQKVVFCDLWHLAKDDWVKLYIYIWELHVEQFNTWTNEMKVAQDNKYTLTVKHQTVYLAKKISKGGKSIKCNHLTKFPKFQSTRNTPQCCCLALSKTLHREKLAISIFYKICIDWQLQNNWHLHTITSVRTKRKRQKDGSAREWL